VNVTILRRAGFSFYRPYCYDSCAIGKLSIGCKSNFLLNFFMPWHVYIIECSDGLLYTGITNNLERRVKAHNSGNGCRFTKYRHPVTLRYTGKVRTRSQALKEEARIKRLPRLKKLELVADYAAQNKARFCKNSIKIKDFKSQRKRILRRLDGI